MIVGYARVSSTGQNLQSQIETLQNAGCEKIFKEKKSGTQATNREELQNALDFVRSGDLFVTTRLDRVSRSVKDLHEILEKLNKKEVAFKCTEQEIDTSTSAGRLMIGLLSIVSAFETDLRAERQASGIKSALKRGVKFGRAKKLSEEEILEIIELQEQGLLTNQQIAEQFNIARSTLLKYVSDYKKNL